MWRLKGGVVVSSKASKRTFGPIQRPFQPKTLTEEVQMQLGKWGRKTSVHVCVNDRERVGVVKSGSCGHEF